MLLVNENIITKICNEKNYILISGEV